MYMKYFSKFNNFNILKNHILKDPVCDWFEISSIKNRGVYCDKQSHYKIFIEEESRKYKESLLNSIQKILKIDIPLYTSYKETKKLIQKNAGLIFQGTLLDKKNQIYVSCDIIISYELFKILFPKISNIPFHLLCQINDYLLINISYATLHFKVDLKDVQNENLVLYKKCKLYAFQEALFEITKKRSQCFLLGKDYYYKKMLLPKEEFICKVIFDENIITSFLKANQWIDTLKKEYYTMEILPKPTHLELYPNMNYTESNWENEKIKLADKIKEITLVWNISYEERCNFLKKGILNWDDPKLLSSLKESKKKDIQERMICMNQQNDILLYPRKAISNELHSILNITRNSIYFDVESFLSFDEKNEFFTNVKPKEEPVLAILGFIFNKHYYNFTIENFTKEKEKEMVLNFRNYLLKIIKKDELLNIFHWGHAEYNYFLYIHKTYPNIQFPKYNLINVLDYFRMEPIIVQGIFKFGLKDVGKALYKNKLIQTTWDDENENGLDTMIYFKKLCIEHKKNIPLKRYLEINKILNYNQKDCQVLYEIVTLLKKKYQKEN